MMLFAAVALATTMTEAVAYDRLKEDTNNRVVLACAISDVRWNMIAIATVFLLSSVEVAV